MTPPSLPICFDARYVALRLASALAGRDETVEAAADRVLELGAAERAARLRQPVLIETIILRLEEYFLGSIAALGHVMRQAGRDDAGDAGRAPASHGRAKKVKTVVSP